MGPNWLFPAMADISQRNTSQSREQRVRYHSAPGGDNEVNSRRPRLGGVSGANGNEATSSRSPISRFRRRSEGSQTRLGRNSKRSQATSGDTTEPDMSELTQRLQTFEGWPADTPVLPLDLARAGFYYMGSGDKVRCFDCNGVLHRWERDDSPLEEHLRFLPNCGFVRSVAGLQEAEQWDHLMDHPVTKKVVEMGFAKEDVRQVALFVVQSGHEVTFSRLVDELVSRMNCDVMKATSFGYDVTSIPQASTSSDMTQADDTGFDDGDQEMAEAAARLSLYEGGAKPRVMSVEDDVFSKLEEDNERLRMLTTCKVCMEGDISVLFLPCRHLVCCRNCSTGLNQCPVCRVAVTGTMKAFLA